MLREIMNCIESDSLTMRTSYKKCCAVAIGNEFAAGNGEAIRAYSPIDLTMIAHFASANKQDVHKVAQAAKNAFQQWRGVPAPIRGEFVRRIGEEFRKNKKDLAYIISAEAGKITQEALGEVQEVIDICDFAVGLSRQLYGLTIASERKDHKLIEQWHPLGPIGVITAFNFPMAVWAWNATIALVCGNTIVWKPSDKTPLCSLACQYVASNVAADMPEVPNAVLNMVIGDAEAGEAVAASREFPLISATGSTSMGKKVANVVAARLGKTLLELGGNNAMVVTPSADLQMAIRAIVFSAVGTCGQRCTTLRRLIVHESMIDGVVDKLIKAYASLCIGDPINEETLVGPLVDPQMAKIMGRVLRLAKEQGGTVHGGGGVDGKPFNYVKPAIVEFPKEKLEGSVVNDETFAPILYVIPYSTLGEAIKINNNVPQGLSSAIFTNDIREAETFCSYSGSDCGIVNVNIGTSGAEIGGAFGGEKETGGGRESGSDAWKAYMRRSTNTINYSTELPLAQGIEFDIGG